ncbi:glutathione S-transferase C-terminal domain-containing protein [Bradyrhizobium sp. C9]|uniref:glutathione S-transferase C-terminal domain-containing protein n=1 Tax=Bradyrhizobium sp. C9 TaxID=142585 RepID=UPI000BE7C588|nr:glutathione S-transferase C-terminal domain-containing protein [Bradyrhizobium sp. C9]PDT76586.1 glutathione-dependent reductase [Bradyrhizobium sp. C9]
MKLMINGLWRGDIDPTPELKAQQTIHAGRFRDRISADSASGFRAEPGRYHLYASPACPFSHRVLIVRALKQLENCVGLSVLHPHWDTPDGWSFADTPLSTIDNAGNGFQHLHEAYRASAPDYTGKVTVPVLWDRRSHRIVNNESLEIAGMLNDASDAITGDRGLDLCPAELKPAMDDLNGEIARRLSVGVYAVAGARHQGEYTAAMDQLFGFLDELDDRLSDGRRFCLGERPTLADVLVYATLVRFDAVYNPLFRASRRRLVDYPHLPGLLKRFHALPGVGATLCYDHILTHYYDGDWTVATRRGIVPELPVTNWLAPHRT